MSALCGPMFANSEPVAWAPWQPDEHLNVSQTSPHDAWVAHASSEAGTSQSESELWGVDPDTARLGDESWFNTNESSYSTEPLAMPLGQEEPQRAPFALSFEPSSVPGRRPLHHTCREIDDAESTEREDSEDSDVDASIRCPNCGEVKGSKGTWCRSPSCAKRRETLAKAQIRKVDSKTVFQYDEPAYRTPPVPEPEVVVEKPRTVSGAPARPAASQAPREAPLKKPRPAASETTAPASAKQSSPRELFMAEVTELQEKNGTPFAKVPTVGMKALDLYTLYEEVSSRGGLHEVVKNKMWKSVAGKLKLPTTCTDYGFRLRRHYERYLLAYEQKHLGTAVAEKPSVSGRKKRKQRSERASRRAENRESANPYSKRYSRS